MTEKDKTTTFRIRLICRFLDKGGGSLADMHSWITDELEKADKATIGLRTLQSCIELLRKGDFIHSLQDLDRKKRASLFKVLYKNKKYSWAPDTEKPVFGDLEEDERFTLPFVASLLKKYENIPAIRKILDGLPEAFGITEQEMKSASVIFNSGPVLYAGQTNEKNYYERVIALVITILGNINRQEVIEFHYTPVSIQDEALQSKRYHRVAPLQIRFFNELYYLTAIDIKDEYIINFRIDQIFRLSADVCKTEKGKTIHFNAQELEKKYKLDDHFKNVLGIWNHEKKDKVYEIHIMFKEWAAGYISKLQFHPTQKIISIDKEKNTCTISLTLKLGPEKYAGQKANERSPELNFLLGRFGEFAEVVKSRVV